MSDPASAAAVSGRAACSAAISASPLLVAVPDLVVVVAAISKILQKRLPELNQSRRSKSLVSSRRRAFLLQKTVNRAEYAAGASNRRGNDDHAQIPAAEPLGMRQNRKRQDYQENHDHRQQERIDDLRPNSQPDELRDPPDKRRSPQYARCVDTVEKRCVKELSFRRPAVARRFTERPGQRQRTHDRRHDRGAKHAAAEDEASQSDAEMGRQRLADLPEV